MKRLSVLFIIILVILSSCGYSYNDIAEMKESWDHEYFVLEEKYDESSERVDELETVLANINEKFAIVYCYYIEHEDDITEKEALAAIESVEDILYNFYNNNN